MPVDFYTSTGTLSFHLKMRLLVNPSLANSFNALTESLSNQLTSTTVLPFFSQWFYSYTDHLPSVLLL